MKERDVRQGIESFLKRTARELIIPALVGLSLGLSGCTPVYGTIPPEPPQPAADAGADVGVDTALPDAGVAAVAQDADVDLGMIDGETD